MSKYVKELVTRDLKRRLEGVEDAVLVNCTGMDANTTNELRGELGQKDIQMMVVKNSLARRATKARLSSPRSKERMGKSPCSGAQATSSVW